MVLDMIDIESMIGHGVTSVVHDGDDVLINLDVHHMQVCVSPSGEDAYLNVYDDASGRDWGNSVISDCILSGDRLVLSFADGSHIRIEANAQESVRHWRPELRVRIDRF